MAQLSKVLGFQRIAVTRNNKYTEALLYLGTSCVVDTPKISLHEIVMEFLIIQIGSAVYGEEWNEEVSIGRESILTRTIVTLFIGISEGTSFE